MKEFMKNHQVLAEIWDIAVSVLAGSFALIAIVIEEVKSMIRKRRENE